MKRFISCLGLCWGVVSGTFGLAMVHRHVHATEPAESPSSAKASDAPPAKTSKVTSATAHESAAGDVPPGMALPEYDANGKLLRPVDFERWVVVGTSVGLSYSDGPAETRDNPGQFHNVYMQPEAFDHFVRTGEFPHQTVFVVTNNPSQATAGKDQLNRHGFFASPATGLEVSVKDAQRFDDGWGYFMFHGASDDAKPRDTESAFASADCYDCHAEHGKQDAVFTQFYSVLTSARERQLAKMKK